VKAACPKSLTNALARGRTNYDAAAADCRDEHITVNLPDAPIVIGA
jgi:hypothetical protein